MLQYQRSKAPDLENTDSFYQIIPKDARVTNKQIHQAEVIKKNLREDLNFPVTEKDKNLIKRLHYNYIVIITFRAYANVTI